MNVLLILPTAENPEYVYNRELSARFPQLTVQGIEHHERVGPFIETADIVMSFSPFMADHVVRDAKRLKWIQVLGSGVDGIVNLPSLRKDVLITSGRGVQATPVSEAAFSLMLALSREMPRMLKNQMECKWERWPSQVLEGCTLGILGVGQIGEALARKAHAFGMRVVGISSSTREVERFDRMYLKSQLNDAVRELDYLVLLTPHSPETHHIVNDEVLAHMKPSAFLINVARGGVVDEAALAHALRNNIIRGAALDVFQEEPLPAVNEMWKLPNVIVSPHLAGLNSSYPQSILPLLERNISRFLTGKLGEMENIISRN
ncbi:MAG TPA: D-2-hydroxyacid dehydrogenase [Steroidobacteraceae bacterium]|nr:D-2-hydroxyacid dehydrogenase [Steroidobacteraceae bacterium]